MFFFASTKEVAAHIAWLNQLPITHFDLAFNMHEDWESKGFYLYSLESDKEHSFVSEIITSVSKVCPIDQSAEIDGMTAKEGVMQLGDDIKKSELYASDEWPESFYLLEKFNPPFKYTFETPSITPLEQRILAQCEASKACVKALKALHRTP